MVTIDTTTSLNLVKEQLDDSLSDIETYLQHFAEDTSDVQQLENAIAYIHELKGVFKVIGLSGAAILTENMEDLAAKLLASEASLFDSDLSILGSATLILSHYLEYVQERALVLQCCLSLPLMTYVLP